MKLLRRQRKPRTIVPEVITSDHVPEGTVYVSPCVDVDLERAVAKVTMKYYDADGRLLWPTALDAAS